MKISSDVDNKLIDYYPLWDDVEELRKSIKGSDEAEVIKNAKIDAINEVLDIIDTQPVLRFCSRDEQLYNVLQYMIRKMGEKKLQVFASKIDKLSWPAYAQGIDDAMFAIADVRDMLGNGVPVNADKH